MLAQSRQEVFRLLLCLVIFGIGTYCAVLPPQIKKCQSGDNVCIAEAIEQVVRMYPKGDPALNIPRLDNFELDNVTIAKATAGSPLQLNFHFEKVNIFGVENLKVERVSGFEKDIGRVKQSVWVSVPKLTIRGTYKADGKVLLLPIDGGGLALIELKDVKVQVKAQLKEEVRDGKKYLVVAKLRIAIKPEGVKLDIENLFKTNKELSASINKVINENWRDIWQELNEGINNAIERIFRNFLVSVFDKLPYDEFYLDS